MIHEFVRQEGMEEGLSGRVRRCRVEQSATLSIDHVLIGKLFQLAQLPNSSKPDSRKTGRLNVAHIPTGPFDAKRVYLVAGDVSHRGLHRGVAAAMKNQPGIVAEQPCGVDAQGQIFADGLFRVMPNSISR